MRVGWPVRLIAGLGFVFLTLPLLVVIPVSFGRSSMLQFPPREFSLRWYEAFLTDPQWLAALSNSLQLGAMVAVCSVTLATLAALGLSGKPFAGRALLQAVLLSPLIVPVVVTAVGLFYFFSLLHLTGTLTALVISHTVLTFPYGIVVIGAALDGFDGHLRRAALSLGASPWRSFFHVTLPIIRPSLIVAGLFAFLISFDEVVVAMFLSSPSTETLPVKMWQGIRFDLDPTIAAISTLLVLFSGGIAIAGEVLRQRSPVRSTL